MTNNENTQRLAEIKARCEAATPGEMTQERIDEIKKLLDAPEYYIEDLIDISFELLCEVINLTAVNSINAELIAKQYERWGSARKWARRWKSLARKRYGHENYYKGRLLCYREQVETLKAENFSLREEDRIWDKHSLAGIVKQSNILRERIASLENACRSCATCIYHVSDLEPTPEYCHKHCRDEDIRHKGWVFNEARFTKGEKIHD